MNSVSSTDDSNTLETIYSEWDNDLMTTNTTPMTTPELPPIFLDLLQNSCLIPALSSYLQNDSGKLFKNSYFYTNFELIRYLFYFST